MKFLIVLCAAAAFACGGTDTSVSTSVNGTVGGTSFSSVVDSQAIVFSNGTCDNTSPTSNFVIIVLSSTAGICGDLTSLKSPANTASLQMLVTTFWVNPSATGAAPANSPALELNKPYSIVSNLDTAPRDSNGFGVAATANFDSTDATCNSKLSGGEADATSGTITLSSLSSSGASGSFSLTFASGTLSGTFSTGSCGFTTAQVCGFFTNTSSSTCG